MEIGFEHSLRVTLKPSKILSMGTFFTPDTNVSEKKVGKGYLLEIRFYGRSGVFTTSIHLNFYQVMSLYVYIFHFTALLIPQMIKVASARGSRGCWTNAMLATPPYDPLRVRVKERVFCEASFMANTG